MYLRVGLCLACSRQKYGSDASRVSKVVPAAKHSLVDWHYVKSITNEITRPKSGMTVKCKAAVKMGTLAYDRGTLVALSHYCGNVNDTQNVESTIQTAYIPIRDLFVYGSTGDDLRIVRKTLNSFRLILCMCSHSTVSGGRNAFFLWIFLPGKTNPDDNSRDGKGTWSALSNSFFC